MCVTVHYITAVVLKLFSWRPGKQNFEEAATQCVRRGFQRQKQVFSLSCGTHDRGGGVQTRNFRAATQRDPVPNAIHQLPHRDPVTHSKPVFSFISLTKTIDVVTPRPSCDLMATRFLGRDP